MAKEGVAVSLMIRCTVLRLILGVSGLEYCGLNPSLQGLRFVLLKRMGVRKIIIKKGRGSGVTWIGFPIE